MTAIPAPRICVRLFAGGLVATALAHSLLVPSLPARGAPTPHPNLLSNGGFDSWVAAPACGSAREFPRFGPEGIPAGWNWGAEVCPDVTSPDIHFGGGIFRDSSFKHDGDCSARFENPNVWDIVALWREIPVESNTVYHISCWCRGENIVSTRGDGVLFWARWGPRKEFWRTNTVIASAPETHSGTFDWQSHDFTVETGDDTQIMDVTIQLRNASGTAWFDDMQVVKMRTVDHVPTF